MLLESELFGCVKGFAGASRSKEGLLAAAGGTVLLDEIGELPLDLQSKLLRVLQEKEIRPAGAANPIPIKVRILAASNRDLVQMTDSGRFRRDLYHRINVVTLRIPPLRERPQDIPLLAAYFLDRISRETGIDRTLSDDSLRIMTEYEWPENVRELEHAIEHASRFSSGPILHLGDLTTQLQNFHLASRRSPVATPVLGPELASVQDPVLPLAELEKNAVLDTLRRCDGDKLEAARLLGIGKTTLYRKLKEYGIGDQSA